MGTRNLIEVKLDGVLKVAQYGQWDGYPTGQGKGIANFIHEQMDKDKFKQALANCRFMTDEEIEAVDSGDWRTSHPWLSRDVGSDILEAVQEGGARELISQESFKDDRVFCEFYYLIDMDNETVSINKQDPIPFDEFTSKKMEEIEAQDEED